MPIDADELIIDRLGARGDGVAETESGPIYVPFALPDECVRVEAGEGGRARLVEVVRPSLSRISPLCRHFGTCGGCQVQHLDAASYLDWKRGLVRAAFAARGLDADVGSVMSFPQGRRRRATFAVRRDGQKITFGFHMARGHEIVGLAECPVLAPEIERALPGLLRLAAHFLRVKDEIELTALLADNGLDAGVEGVKGPVSPAVLEAVAKTAAAIGLRRVSVGGEAIFLTETPFVSFGSAKVMLPPGVFLQAMAEAESAMMELVRASAGKAKRVADLFCGLGAFTFPLAARAEILAVDSDPAAMEALSRAARATPGLKKITPQKRDLFRAPLSPAELKAFDAVILNPPRAGAKAQAEALARSKVPVAVAVSCNMATLARDARTLVDGGYRIASITPVDQFQYTAHVEVVAEFRR